MFLTDAQQLTGYATGQLDTQPDDRLHNWMVTCACTNRGKVSHSLIHVLWMHSKNYMYMYIVRGGDPTQYKGVAKTPLPPGHAVPVT